MTPISLAAFMSLTMCTTYFRTQQLYRNFYSGRHCKDMINVLVGRNLTTFGIMDLNLLRKTITDTREGVCCCENKRSTIL